MNVTTADLSLLAPAPAQASGHAKPSAASCASVDDFGAALDQASGQFRDRTGGGRGDAGEENLQRASADDGRRSEEVAKRPAAWERDSRSAALRERVSGRPEESADETTPADRTAAQTGSEPSQVSDEQVAEPNGQHQAPTQPTMSVTLEALLAPRAAALSTVAGAAAQGAIAGTAQGAATTLGQATSAAATPGAIAPTAGQMAVPFANTPGATLESGVALDPRIAALLAQGSDSATAGAVPAGSTTSAVPGTTPLVALPTGTPPSQGATPSTTTTGTGLAGTGLAGTGLAGTGLAGTGAGTQPAGVAGGTILTDASSSPTTGSGDSSAQANGSAATATAITGSATGSPTTPASPDATATAQSALPTSTPGTNAAGDAPAGPNTTDAPSAPTAEVTAAKSAQPSAPLAPDQAAQASDTPGKPAVPMPGQTFAEKPEAPKAAVDGIEGADLKASSPSPNAAPTHVVSHSHGLSAPAPAPGAAVTGSAPTLAQDLDAIAGQLAGHIGPLRHDRDGHREMTVMLHPEELGAVRIRVEMRDGVISLNLMAAQDSSADLLQSSLPQLRQQLEDSGVNLGGTDVSRSFSETPRRESERRSFATNVPAASPTSAVNIRSESTPVPSRSSRIGGLDLSI